MLDWSGVGKAIALIGIALTLIGGLMALAGKYSGEGHGLEWFGNLPGDIRIKRDSFSVYFPLTTSILISVIISVVAYLLSLLKR
ncbi:MAG: DUF2905 domain-containing protein [Nitrospiraceae bacterium]